MEEKRESDILFVKADNPDLWDRKYVHVTKDSNSVISIEGTSFTENQLRGIVYKASKSGETEQELCGRDSTFSYPPRD